MSKFIYGDELNTELIKLIENAEEQLLIISPFIKLHDRIKDKLKAISREPQIEVTIVYGKNRIGLSENDASFLMALPNIDIRYEPRLHAKYYANENDGILTSMNLYDFSQNNNIEFGVLTKASSLSKFWNPISGGTSVDDAAFEYFMEVLENSQPCFKRIPKFIKGSESDEIYSHSETTLNSFSSNDSILNSNDKPIGYCIRTGRPIQFNPLKPFSYEAFVAWSKYRNPDYREKFCHFSGEPSNGETSFAKPILSKNEVKAKEIHKL